MTERYKTGVPKIGHECRCEVCGESPGEINRQLLEALKDVRDNAADDSPAMWDRVDAAIKAAEEGP